MEQKSGSPKSGRRIPLWLLLVLCGVLLVMTLAIAFLVLLHLDIIRCVPVDAPQAEATAVPAANTPLPDPVIPGDPVPVGSTTEPPAPVDPQTQTAAPDTTETAAPATDAPAITEAPTAVPTPAPTAEPTAAPTPVPDYFWFGGAKVKTGSTSVVGKKLGINGKKNKLTHIPENEVNDLVTLCPDLEELDLEYCFMDDYKPLGGLVKLHTLKLIYCGAGDGNAIKDIGWAENLTELRTLSFSHNSIEDTAPLAGLTKLTYLHLAGNPLENEDLEPIGKLTNLETLYLYDLKKITDVSPLAKLTKLTFLHIGHNSRLKSVKSLTSLKKLKYLRLNNTKFSDLSYIGKFAALYKLDISNCPIDEETVMHLPECKKLKKIVLDPTDNDILWALLNGPIGPDWDVKILYNWSE